MVEIHPDPVPPPLILKEGMNGNANAATIPQVAVMALPNSVVVSVLTLRVVLAVGVLPEREVVVLVRIAFSVTGHVGVLLLPALCLVLTLPAAMLLVVTDVVHLVVTAAIVVVELGLIGVVPVVLLVVRILLILVHTVVLLVTVMNVL